MDGLSHMHGGGPRVILSPTPKAGHSRHHPHMDSNLFVESKQGDKTAFGLAAIPSFSLSSSLYD